ncbi:MAG TPA: hypothetical protein VEX68_05935 [Bryobacteraceae bacterium]|nr:hypothetical protein [Bryobacteraceae bacterium]
MNFLIFTGRDFDSGVDGKSSGFDSLDEVVLAEAQESRDPLDIGSVHSKSYRDGCGVMTFTG